jgi:fructosamine-3-kinase
VRSASPLETLIGEASGRAFTVAGSEGTGGGCINAAERIVGRDGRRYFVKWNDADRLEMFAAEADGLREILASGTLRAPRPVGSGTADSRAFLVLEYLELEGRGDEAELGRQLAAMHRQTAARFGWWRANTIGATPQDNAEADDWVEFWRRRRLAFQLDLAARRGAPRRLLDLGERLLAALPAFFPGHTPVASLLHGDLWGGNFGFCAGAPVVFDPAVYYGDREADLAMTELFGGFGARFYAAYREAWPPDPGYALRRDLYNLYHVLNHFNLFGGGYAGQAERMLAGLLAECGGRV